MKGRVKIESGPIAGVNTKITDAETGAPIRGVTGVEIKMVVGEPNVATLTLLAVETGLEATPRFVMIHPVTGEHMTIKRVIFADGREWMP